MNTRFLSRLWVAGMLVGCAETQDPAKGRTDLLDFLADGRTPRRQVLERLGQPSGRFDGGNILTYRLACGKNTKSYQVVAREATASGWPTWLQAKYSLVLVFDGGVLRKHTLVEVN